MCASSSTGYPSPSSPPCWPDSNRLEPDAVPATGTASLMSGAPRVGSLFTGYGGLDLAVADVFGARTVWVSDIDPGANMILAHRFPGVPNLGDITTVDWATVEPVEIITGGFPCQDVSQAGRRAGLIRGETRTGLWQNMLAAVDALRPRLVVAENVRGLLSATADSDVEPCPWCVGDNPDGVLRALGAVLGDLADVGYDAQWFGLRASDVGAAHRRFRVFITAYPRGDDGHEWRLATATQAAGGRPFGQPARRGGAPVALLPTPSASTPNDGEELEGWEARRRRVAQALHNGNGMGTPLSVAVRLLPTPVTTDANAAGSPAGSSYRGNSLTDATVRQPDRWGVYAEAIARHEAAFGRPAPEPTQPGRHGKPRLSARFTEWLMGLPPGWVCDVPGLTRAQQLKALGNGVVPAQAAAALLAMAGRLP